MRAIPAYNIAASFIGPVLSGVGRSSQRERLAHCPERRPGQATKSDRLSREKQKVEVCGAAGALVESHYVDTIEKSLCYNMSKEKTAGNGEDEPVKGA